MNEWMNELINWPSSLGRYGWVLQSKCAFWTAISGSACKTFKFWKIFDFDKNPRDDLGKGGWHGVVRFDQQTCIFNSSQWVCILTTWILKDLWLTKIERMSWAREAYKGVVHFKQQTCNFNSNQRVCMFVSRGTCLSMCLSKKKKTKKTNKQRNSRLHLSLDLTKFYTAFVDFFFLTNENKIGLNSDKN